MEGLDPSWGVQEGQSLDTESFTQDRSKDSELHSSIRRSTFKPCMHETAFRTE